MSRTVLITGANRGIGLATARLLADAGDQVITTARDPRTLPPGGRQLDVTDPASIARLAAELPRLDVLVNNAAIDYDTDALASTADLTRVRKAFDTNLFGVWQLTLALLPLLRASAHPRIVNVSSESGSISQLGAGTPGYSTSKAALNALTRILAAELQPEGILVNAVCPGWVATDMGGPGGGPITEGAASVAWAVRLADHGPTGGFFRHGEPLPW